MLVFAPDSIDWAIAYLGAIWAGGVGVGLNSRLFERELTAILAESGARFVWCSPESVPRLEQILERIPFPPALITSEEFSRRVARATPVPAAERSATDAALWIYTSGTTGMPKAVIHAQRTVLGVAEFMTDVLGVGPDARVYASSKLFFAYALGNGLLRRARARRARSCSTTSGRPRSAWRRSSSGCRRPSSSPCPRST